MQNQTTLVPSLSFVDIGSEKIDTETLESYLHDVHHGPLFDSLDPTAHFNYNTHGVLPSPGMPLLNFDYKMMASPPMNVFNIPFGITKADEDFSNQVQFVQPLPDIDGRQGNFASGYVTPAYTPQSQHLELNVDVLSFPISSDVPEEVSSKKSTLKARKQRRPRLSNEEREFECSVDACGRKFKRSEHLKRHMRSHNGEKPYPCEQCGKKFSRSDNLKQHMKIHRKKGHFSGNDSSVTTVIDPSYQE